MNNKNNLNRPRYNNQGHNKNRNRQQRFTAPERLSINKVYDSNGPMGRQRGNASTLYEKYTTLARDAHSAGDRVLSENLMQHAEHYLRIINSIQEQMQSVYTESYREPDSNEEQSYSEAPQFNSYTEQSYEPQSPVAVPVSVPTAYERSGHVEQAESFGRDDTYAEKPQQQRRKMYPYARRKPYDPNYHQTQNANQGYNNSSSSYNDAPPVVATPSNVYHAESPTPTPPVSVNVDNADNHAEAPKPRRIVRRRIVTPDVSQDTPKGTSDI